MNIFDISKELQSIFEEIEDNDGELTEELESKLSVSENDFKEKVKSYGEVIKTIKGEISLIDNEILRLKALKDAKEKTISRLEKIIIWAVTTFGDETKSGGKYLDYGTGKISVRNTEKVEVDSDTVDSVVKNFFSYINMLNYTKELNNYNGIDVPDFVKSMEDSENPITITENEIKNIQASFSFDINLQELIKGEGFEFVRHFLKVVKGYKIKSNVAKSDVKSAIKDGQDLHNIAKIVQNQTVTIK